MRFRKVQLQAKRNVEASKRKERELLFAGTQEGNITINRGRQKGRERLSQDELVDSAKNDVTAGLRRLHQLLSAEVEKSQFARDTLGIRLVSTSNLSYTNSIYQISLQLLLPL